MVCTGIGAYPQQNLALKAYWRIVSGMPLKQALEQAMALLPHGVQIAPAGTTADEAEVVSRLPMASARLEEGR
ncbi:MAG TPA: hypothetical protein VFP68_21890 [Burkholderiaceae bacterium]|nr:hypothetical protein [Burkholderiaceae bacterium]